MSRIRILVADQAEAVFYDAASPGKPPTEVGRITDPAAHLHDRDFSSDRPGRYHASIGGGRHAFGHENDPRHFEAVRFARRIARRLDEARRRDEYEQLVVIAGAPFLGVVREELSKPTRERVALELRKDLVHSPRLTVQRQIARSVAALTAE